MEIKHLNVSYNKVQVLHDLDMYVQDEGINGLVGMNGAGKTTLLNAIYGFKEKMSGEINYKGGKLRASQIGFLEAENFFYNKIKGSEYLEIFRLNNKDFDIEAWNEVFELPLDQLVDEYSTGMKKKLALMGIIGLDRPVMLLDEPFNGVDLESNEKIKIIMKKLKERGKTIIVTSHIIETLTTTCDRISVLNNGKIEKTATKLHFGEIEEYLHHSITVGAQRKIDKIFDEN
ncbi:ATP-binding cassette domain-containing protein [bacterium]|nr:ATP-binding cassette domain-containing protein [bacterium]